MELLKNALNNDASLYAYWQLEGNSTDSKSHANGTDTNITYSTANGRFGQGAGFNGTSSGIALPNVQPSTALSISAWINPADVPVTGTNYQIMSKGNNTDWSTLTFGFFLVSDGSKLNLKSFLAYDSNPGNTVTGTTAITGTSGWLHCVLSYQASTFVKLYLNGKEEASLTTGVILQLKSSADVLAIGKDGTAASRYFKGKIDDVALFTKALSATEVANLYKNRGGAWFFNQL